MKRIGAVLLLSIAGALAVPVGAYAVDHVVLVLKPTKLAKTGKLAAWQLDGRMVDSPFYGGQEIFGVSLRRAFLNGRAEELHGFRAAPARSVTFDGVRGRWDARFGAVLTVRMAITTTGVPQPAGEAQGCRGAFVQVPVSLQGTLALRTGTSLFKTVRRTRLAGWVIFNSGGPVDMRCGGCAVVRADRDPERFEMA